MLQVQLEVAQEKPPAFDHTVVLGVPLGATPEPGVDPAHDARAPVTSFDEPYEGQPVDALAAVEDDPVRRLPRGHPTVDVLADTAVGHRPLAATASWAPTRSPH